MKSFLLSITLVFSISLHSQDNLQSYLGQSIEEVNSMINTRVTHLTRNNAGDILPITAEPVNHLIAENFQFSDQITVDKIIFSYVNDQVILIQTKDIRVANELIKTIESNPMDYAGHTIYPDYCMTINKENQLISIFPKEYLHSHIFLWENPALRTEIKRIPRAVNLLQMPLEGGIANIMTQFSPRSQLINKRVISDSPFQGISSHVQLDCFGYHYFEFPRKVEFVLLDDQLEYLWVLIGKAEIPKIKILLEAMTGGIEKETANYIWFADGRTAIRKDVAEVLICSEKYRSHFEY